MDTVASTPSSAPGAVCPPAAMSCAGSSGPGSDSAPPIWRPWGPGTNTTKSTSTNRRGHRHLHPHPPPRPAPRIAAASVCGDDGCGGSCGSCAAGQFCRTGTCCTPRSTEVHLYLQSATINVPCPGRCDTVNEHRHLRPIRRLLLPHRPGLSQQRQLRPGLRGLRLSRSVFELLQLRCQHRRNETLHRCHFVHGAGLHETADCPVGTHCQVTTCGPNGNDKRCVRLSFCPG